MNVRRRSGLMDGDVGGGENGMGKIANTSSARVSGKTQARGVKNNVNSPKAVGLAKVKGTVNSPRKG